MLRNASGDALAILLGDDEVLELRLTEANNQNAENIAKMLNFSMISAEMQRGQP